VFGDWKSSTFFPPGEAIPPAAQLEKALNFKANRQDG
jgi:hypothetical protein